MCVAPLQLWLLAGREVISCGLSQSVLALSPAQAAVPVGYGEADT
jgi:hypothetical protein